TGMKFTEEEQSRNLWDRKAPGPTGRRKTAVNAVPTLSAKRMRQRCSAAALQPRGGLRLKAPRSPLGPPRANWGPSQLHWAVQRTRPSVPTQGAEPAFPYP